MLKIISIGPAQVIKFHHKVHELNEIMKEKVQLIIKILYLNPKKKYLKKNIKFFKVLKIKKKKN